MRKGALLYKYGNGLHGMSSGQTNGVLQGSSFLYRISGMGRRWSSSFFRYHRYPLLLGFEDARR
jgi:hypothetical protein